MIGFPYPKLMLADRIDNTKSMKTGSDDSLEGSEVLNGLEKKIGVMLQGR